MHITIPYKPRDIFLPFHNRTARFGAGVAHRRCGKTVAGINELIKGAVSCQKKNPQFSYLAPYLKQAKLIAWKYVKEYCANIPHVKFNESELKVTFAHNNGEVRLFGADNADALRGSYNDGLLIDEYPDMKANIWGDILLPTLADREGWAFFIGTSKGKDDFYKKLQEAIADPDKFTFNLKASETNVFTEEQLADIRKECTQEQYNQEFENSFESAIVGALWTREILNRSKSYELPEMKRIVIAIDVAVTSNENSDEHGIIVQGLGTDNKGYVLEDASIKGTPNIWAARAIAAFDKYEADTFVVETNQGGDMIKHTLQTQRPNVPVIEVRATKGKHVRAEPISALYVNDKIGHYGDTLAKLENQMCMTTNVGYEGKGSPDRLDAMVWGFTELFPSLISKPSLPKKRLNRNAGSWNA